MSGTLPAHEIDNFVTEELIGLLARQAELCQIVGADDPAHIDLIGAKAELTSAEIKLHPRRDIVLQIADKVTVSEKHISIAINRHGLRALLTNTQAPIRNDTGTPRLITRAFQIKRCGHGRKLIIGQNKDSDSAQPDSSLLRTVARAHTWLNDLKSGLSYKEIATRDAIDERLVARTVRLAFLAPDITKAILAGREPRGLSVSVCARDAEHHGKSP